MLATQEVDRIERRKRELQAASNGFRENLRVQLECAQSAVPFLTGGTSSVWRFMPALICLAPLVGYFAFKKRKSLMAVFGKASASLSMMNSGLAYLRSLSRR